MLPRGFNDIVSGKIGQIFNTSNKKFTVLSFSETISAESMGLFQDRYTYRHPVGELIVGSESVESIELKTPVNFQVI